MREKCPRYSQRMYVKMKPAPNADPAEVDDSWHLDFIKATHRGTLKTKSHTRWFYLRVRAGQTRRKGAESAMDYHNHAPHSGPPFDAGAPLACGFEISSLTCLSCDPVTSWRRRPETKRAWRPQEWLPPNQEREMLARDGPLPKREAKPSHVIHVQTETGPRPGADVLPDSVSISIQGDRAQTDFATLRADPGTVPFRVGAIDHFKVPHQDVGEPQFVHVQVDSGSAAEVRWSRVCETAATPRRSAPSHSRCSKQVSINACTFPVLCF